MARIANDLSSSAQYRLCETDPATIEIKPKHGAHWRPHCTCKPIAEFTAEQIAEAWLATLGRLPKRRTR